MADNWKGTKEVLTSASQGRKKWISIETLDKIQETEEQENSN